MPAWAMQLVQRQPVTHSETLSQKDKEEKKEEEGGGGGGGREGSGGHENSMGMCSKHPEE